MKFLILHLSDIHIQRSEDPILGRVSRVVDAVKNLEPEARAVICVLSGDVTFSGSEDQFLLALEFVTGLKSELAKYFTVGVTISFVAVPGNHDCDFSEGTEARSFLKEAVLRSPSKLKDESFAEILLGPERRFFQFLEAIETPLPLPLTGIDSRLYRQYEIKIDGQSITICCCNSAVLSELHERPGTLVFPVSVLPVERPTSDISLGVVHHPYNWLQPDNAREFRTQLEGITDFLLTGHEHTLDRRNTSTEEANNLYLEGGVLQDFHNPAQSEFYSVVIDVDSAKQRIIGFSWDGTRYTPTGSDDPEQYHLWEDFARNRLRIRDTFQLQPQFEKYLEDPELTLNHKTRGELKLSDIYVFPDLRRVNLTGEKGTKIIRGDEIGELVCKTPCLSIIGDDVSGKTALAKALFKHLYAIGDVPVLIDAAITPLSPRRCEQQIESAFQSGYSNPSLEAYRQLDRARRVVIIDNYHRLKLTSTTRLQLLEKLRSHSFRLIVFAHDIAITLHDMSEAGETIAGDLPFSYYSVLPLGKARRNRLVEKWLLLNGDIDQNTSAFVHNLAQVTTTIDTLVGNNYVPAYPPYVLAVLQGADAGSEIDVNASTHGYLYELFIKAAIARAGSAVAYNIFFRVIFLTSPIGCLSFSKRKCQRPSFEYFMTSCRKGLRYCRILSDYFNNCWIFDSLRSLTTEFSSPIRISTITSFAVYIRDHIGDAKIKEEVRLLSRGLYDEDNASTLFVFGAPLQGPPDNECAASRRPRRNTPTLALRT